MSQTTSCTVGPLRDRHLRLCDRPVAGDLDRAAAEEVEDADAAFEALAGDADEVGRRPLEPGRHHEAVLVPDRREAFPVARVAPQHPLLDHPADLELGARALRHDSPPSRLRRTPAAASATCGSIPSSRRSSAAASSSSIRRRACRALPSTRRSTRLSSASPQRRGDVRPEPVGAAGGVGGGETLEHGGGQPLHEDAAEELSCGRGSRLGADDVDRGSERAQDLRVVGGAVTRGERRCADPTARHRGEERDVGERRAGRADDSGDLPLQRDARRVQVGEQGAGRERCRRRFGGGERARAGVEAEHEVGSCDRVAGARCAPQARDGSARSRVPSCSRDTEGDEVGGECRRRPRRARVARRESARSPGFKGIPAAVSSSLRR